MATEIVYWHNCPSKYKPPGRNEYPMPIRVIPIDKLQDHKRGRKAAIDSLPELRDAKVKLSNGLTPYQAIEIELPRLGIKNLRNSFRMHMKDYLKNLKLTDYEISAFTSEGTDYVTISHNPPLTPRAAMPIRRYAPHAREKANGAIA